MKKKVLAMLAVLVLLLGTIPFSAMAIQKKQTVLQKRFMNSLDVNDEGTTVFLPSEVMLQTSFELKDTQGEEVGTELSEITAVILEDPSLTPYHKGYIFSGNKAYFYLNFEIPQTPGNYTMRVSYSGNELNEACYLDVPFSVVAQKKALAITLDVGEKVATGHVFEGTLTSEGTPVSGKTVNVMAYVDYLFGTSSEPCTTDENGNFSFTLTDDFIAEVNNFIENSSNKTVMVEFRFNIFGDNTYPQTDYSQDVKMVKDYNLVWLDVDDSVLDSQSYFYGDTVPQTAKVPAKAADATYSYAFCAWDNGTVEGNTTTYRPLFTPSAHNPAEAVAENNNAPTCTQAGAYESVVYCSDCGYEISRTHVDVAALGHDFATAWTTDNVTHWHICSRCEVRGEEAAHVWNAGTVTTAATCTAEGEKKFTCTVCNAVKTESVVPLGHGFAAAWANDDSTHWHACSRCDVRSEEAAHAWDTGAVTAAPGCTTEGIKTFTCTVCGTAKTESIAPLGHSLNHVERAEPTATQSGNSEYWCCADCGKFFEDAAAGTEILLPQSVILPAVPEYSFESPESLEWTQGGEDLGFTLHRSIEDEKTLENFAGLELDGSAVEVKDFTAAAGSVNITLKAALLETLAIGEHTLKVLFHDGMAQKELIVFEAPAEEENEEPAEVPEEETEAPAVDRAPVAKSESKSPATGDSIAAVMLAAVLGTGIGIATLPKKKREE